MSDMNRHKISAWVCDDLPKFYLIVITYPCHKCNASLIDPYQLTHLSLVPHICVSELGQHWFR